MLFQDDNHALSMGRYYRAARFPVVNPEITFLSYEKLIRLELLKLGFLRDAEKQLLRQLLRKLLDYMMCLPASSTFHHRTAGGMFYHSLETAALAAAEIRESDVPTEGRILAAFLGGLFHDLGKVLTLFHVYPLCLADQDRGFGSLQEPDPDRDRWQPMEESLWAWCRRQGVRYLALQYQTDGPIGHEAAAAPFWRSFLPDELIQAVTRRDAEAAQTLADYLDHTKFHDPLIKTIKSADTISIGRDINPEFRWQPKRSDLHIIRRFIEFASISVWNDAESPFMMADVWVKGTDSGHTLPFFKAWYSNMDIFRDYLLSEDLYGHALSGGGDPKSILAILENHGLLYRRVPICPPHQLKPLDWGPKSSRWTKVSYPEEDWDGKRAISEPAGYFPMGARLAPPGLSAVHVYL